MNAIRTYLNTPNWVQVLMAAVFFGMGLLFFYIFCRTDTLRCERTPQSVDCTRTTTFLKVARLSLQPIQSLQSAGLDENCDDDGCTYRVVLAASDGDIPLSIVYTSDRDGQQRLADRINAFLKDVSRTTLEVENGPGWFILIPLVFIAVGIAFSGASFLNLLRPL